jgi:hypothetical protein
MRYAIGFGALSTLLLLSGCAGDHQPIAPSVVDEAPTPPPTQTACVFPAFAQTDRVYTFAESRLPPAAHTRCSRFVLYENGRFVLQFGLTSAYSGRYSVLDNVVDFQWDGLSVAGPWGADAVLDGDTLRVNYNPVMELSDFEDAVYKLSN